jgi:hypothetical protein
MVLNDDSWRIDAEDFVKPEQKIVGAMFYRRCHRNGIRIGVVDKLISNTPQFVPKRFELLRQWAN